MRKSLFGGYPHDGIKTQEVFPNRVKTSIVENRVFADIDTTVYPAWIDQQSPEQQRDFFMDRLHDANTALGIAEQQIRDMHAEYPFIPQDFGFEETTLKLTDEGFSPTCYAKGKHMIARIDDDNWMITGIAEKGIPVGLHNAHIAFLVLRSLGVVSDADFEEELEFSSADPKPEGLSEEEWEQVKKRREHLTKFGQGKAIWDDEKNRFIVPKNNDYPERLWGTEVNSEDFEWIRGEGDNGHS
jgi:hypothetical protein